MSGRTAVSTLAIIVFMFACVKEPTPPVDEVDDVASVAVSPATTELAIGATLQLSASPKDADGQVLAGRTVTWSSGNMSVATVNDAGVVSGVAAGTADISASIEGKTGHATITVSSAAQIARVFIVVLENRDYLDVINADSMPYLNSLANQYSLATEFYANDHPSTANYFLMTTGDTVTSNGSFQGIVRTDNVVRRLLAAGRTWKSYAENLPSVGYIGGDQGLYARRHNVFAWFEDVAENPVQRNNLVPYTQFAGDLANNTLPDYVFMVPNLCNDAHDCALDSADKWLAREIPPLLASAEFQQRGVLIITFDEARTDSRHGGGRIPTVIVGPKVRRNYRSTTFYQQQSMARFPLTLLGVSNYPNGAATAPDMMEFIIP